MDPSSAHPPPVSVDDHSSRIADIRQRVAHQLAVGAAIDIDRIVADHPDLMPELGDELRILELTHRQLLAARRLDNGAAAPIDDDSHVVIPGYRLTSVIGSGGQGTVYRATQLSTGRVVAIKVLTDGGMANSRRHARLQREVAILASLRHRNIVGVIDHGRAADGSLYMAMDYIAGVDLATWIEDHRAQSRSPVDLVRSVLELFIRIVAGVAEAHSRNIVHRDLKPPNILVDAAGEPFLLDFGLARIVDDESSANLMARTVTMEGSVMGTLHWMSPEQAAGNRSDVGAASDVYSVGVMLYDALTGRPPVELTDSLGESLLAIQRTIPIPASDRNVLLSPAIDKVLARALAKRVEDRYPSAIELLADLKAAAQSWTPNPPRPRPHSRRQVALAVVGIAAVATTTAFVWMDRDDAMPVAVTPATSPARGANEMPPDVRLIKILPLDDVFVRNGAMGKLALGDEKLGGDQPQFRLEVRSSPELTYNCRDAYFKFPLSSIPRTGTIHRVCLMIYGTTMVDGLPPQPSTTPRTMVVSLFDLADRRVSVEEKSMTWNNRPYLAGYNDHKAAVGAATIHTGTHQWYDMDITSRVRQAIKTGETSFQVGLHAPDLSDLVAVFRSSETSHPPCLHVYHAP